MNVPTIEEIKKALEIPFKDAGNTSLEHALKINAKFYFTGAPCIRGHISQRLTSNRQCRKCQEIDARANTKRGGKYD